MQFILKIDYRILIFIGLSILWQPGLKLKAQVPLQDHNGQVLSASFVKQEIFQKSGQISFNVIRIRNLTDTAVRIKPVLILPDGWLPFSTPFRDTIVPPHDSISLSFRFQVPVQVNAEIKHEIIFRAYSLRNILLAENTCNVHPEAFHAWDIIIPDKRVFFYPRTNLSEFELLLQNKGNTEELISLNIQPDNKLNLDNTIDWKTGQNILLAPYKDTLLKFNIRYTFAENRVFDISKVQINASASDVKLNKVLLIEKYNDTYAPFYIDRTLPHQTEVGFRTFSGNDRFLPFIKARGISTFKNLSTFQYNFNYYALTGNEDFISNSYYNFLYSWKLLKAGVGAFSSQLGRNLYTRTGVMLSNVIQLSPVFSLEAFVSQSFFTPKTSVAVGYTIEKTKIGLHGSVAYDIDNDKGINTGSMMLQSNVFSLAKNHDLSFNLYGYHEYHDLAYDYTLMGVAWDINYFARFGENVSFQLTNNYGSPNIPGPQMGLLNFAVNSTLLLRDKDKYLSAQYINVSRRYHTYNYEGAKLPDIFLYDQYGNFFFHFKHNPNHKWQAGPSVEAYLSYRPPPPGLNGVRTEYRAQKLRLEYKGTIAKNLTLNLKTGVSKTTLKELTEIEEQKIDFHLLGGYSFKRGFGVSFNYDYGPLVNSGLYQFSGDADNHSFSIGPSLMSAYFNDRLSLNLFANFIYRIDLNYASFNINPKIEAFLYRDFYAVVSGTYHYTRQEYTDFQVNQSYTYLEVSIKKRWGKSDYNKWQKDTRHLKVILFKDDNGNGVKEDDEEGVPYVKIRLQLTNTDNPDISRQFPVDIILLSNESGIVNYNRLPKGFYELTITPLGDVKEYFYVNRSAEKLELSKNATYFVPFQKANKITGNIAITRGKFIKAGEENLDLANIKVTAYNKQGNSYSSFTIGDGSFTIFVPQNNTYYVRMGNVFGPGFKIEQNDIPITIGESMNNQVVFNVNEITRQVKFKQAAPKPEEPDSLQKEALKIKILHGKFYENSKEAAVDKDAVPVFKINEAPVEEQAIIPGNYYVVVGSDSIRTEAVKIKRILDENGIINYLGYHETTRMYYLYTNYFREKGETKTELERLQKAGFRDAKVIKME